jgi:hypothetical protein
MKRTAFLKNACTYGICGCMGLSFLNNSKIFAGSKESNGKDETDWCIDFMQTRFHDLINILNNDLDKETLVPILKQLGTKCGEGFAKNFKNNPQGFFTFIKERWAESVNYDEGKGIIRVNEKVRNSCKSFLQEFFGTLLNKKVKAVIDETVILGGERCCATISFS